MYYIMHGYTGKLQI